MTEQVANANLEFIAAGGNRHPSAADWAPGLLAFGAGNNIALWNPDDHRQNGIYALLAGHTDHVNAVKLFQTSRGVCIISAGADKAIRIWAQTNDVARPFQEQQCLIEHQNSINTISTHEDTGLFVTGSADSTVKIWQLSEDGAKLIQSISLKPRYLPLATALTTLSDGTLVLAVAGTSSSIQVYTCPSQRANFMLQATLTGHEGWIRSLAFVAESEDILLASGSQDKYIRLWRFRQEADRVGEADNGSAQIPVGAKASLSNKTQQVGNTDSKYNVTFEALLVGHEDWIYTTRWAPRTNATSSSILLSASADNSLAVWSADEASGVWVCDTRLGEISAQKGSTTATGSTGGFWIGLWQPEGRSIVSLGRTGSWRRWMYDSAADMWVQRNGVSGHTQEVRSLAWSPDGSYLLTTGSDQTTRLFAEWKRDGKYSWHEFSRPQIHGYDLNCIDSLGSNQFISGADEKLLRVFNKPKATDNLLSRLCGSIATVDGELADAANIPVLGLSNKAIAAVADEESGDRVVNGDGNEREAVDPASVVHRSTLNLDHPPVEDHLARHTLWPEQEKLYGHGYEISAVAACQNASVIATACKASSLDHAVIRLYETKEWREVKPPLASHTLTVNSLAFSGDGRYLLSVGRDRKWTVFGKDEGSPSQYRLLAANEKGHARMILDCSWAPVQAGQIFATAGRDKSVKLWRLEYGKAGCCTTIAASAPVTAVAFALRPIEDRLCLAFGTETGDVQLVWLELPSLHVHDPLPVFQGLNPSQAVNRLCWRPDGEKAGTQLAVASDDGSVRVINTS